MFRTSRNLSTAAAAAAGVLGGVAIATAAPGVTLGASPVGTVQVEDVPDDEVVDDDPVEDDLDAEVREDEGEDEDLDLDLDPPAALDEDDEVDTEESDEDTSAFAAWVRSLPSDWGCVRGHVISAHAAGPKDGFEGPEYGSIEEAVVDLGLEGRCVEVAVARVNGASGDGDGEASGSAAEPGPPAHARGQKRSGEQTGSADAGRGGPPEGRGGPAAERRGPPEGRGGPPEGRGPR